MIMGIMTICLLSYSIVNLIRNGRGGYSNALTRFGLLRSIAALKNVDYNSEEFLKDYPEAPKVMLEVALYSLGQIAILIIKIVYMIVAVISVDTSYFSVIYLTLITIGGLYSLTKATETNKREAEDVGLKVKNCLKGVVEVNKFSYERLIGHLIAVSYFGYMLIIIFR